MSERRETPKKDRRIKRLAMWGTASAAALAPSTTGATAGAGLSAVGFEGRIGDLPEQDGPRVVDHDAGAVELSDRARMQVPLTRASRQIRDLVNDEGLQGFAGTRISMDPPTLILYWKGEPPPRLAALVQDLRADVAIEVRPAAYSLDELTLESARIMDEDIADPDRDIIVKIGPLDDYSGIGVVLDANATPSRRRSATESIQSSIPLEFSTGEAATSLVGRWSDESPFWGGSAIIDTETEFACSSAFSAFKVGGKNESMITALHCTRPGESEHYAGLTDVVVGSAEASGSTPLDVIELTGRDYDPIVYIGAWTSNTGTPVIDVANPDDESVVHANGAFTGSWPALVTRVNEFINVPGLGRVGPVFETNSAGEEGRFDEHLGEGDSGGPTVTFDDIGGVVANGVIVAGSLQPLEGICPDADSIPVVRRCALIGYHSNIENVERSLEVDVQVWP